MKVIAGGDPDVIVAAALPDTHDVLGLLTREERAAVEAAATKCASVAGCPKTARYGNDGVEKFPADLR